MQIKTKPYIDLLEQLRMVAINSNNIEQRDRMRDNMIRLLLRTFDASSIYICSHDNESHATIVRNEFIDSRAKQHNLTTDLGETYDEAHMGNFLGWMYSPDPEPLIVDMNQVDLSDPEYIEYAPYDLETVIYAVLHRGDDVWGYVEIWDSRKNRTFNVAQIDKLKKIVNAINDTLLTIEG